MGEGGEGLVAFGETLYNVLGQGLVLGGLLDFLQRADREVIILEEENHGDVVLGEEGAVLAKLDGKPVVFFLGFFAEVLAGLLHEFL